MVKFAKNDRLDALIVLARDEQFLFFPWKWSKGGTIGWSVCIFFAEWYPTILLGFHLFLTSSLLNMSIPPPIILCICIHSHIRAPFEYYGSMTKIVVYTQSNYGHWSLVPTIFWWHGHLLGCISTFLKKDLWLVKFTSSPQVQKQLIKVTNYR